MLTSFQGSESFQKTIRTPKRKKNSDRVFPLFLKKEGRLNIMGKQPLERCRFNFRPPQGGSHRKAGREGGKEGGSMDGFQHVGASLCACDKGGVGVFHVPLCFHSNKNHQNLLAWYFETNTKVQGSLEQSVRHLAPPPTHVVPSSATRALRQALGSVKRRRSDHRQLACSWPLEPTVFHLLKPILWCILPGAVRT